MYASKKYMIEMIAKYSFPGIKPKLSNYKSHIQYNIPSAPAQKIVKSDPNIEIAKLQRSRSQNAASKVNTMQPPPQQNQIRPPVFNTSRSNFIPDRRRPYDNVKISRLAPATKQIVDRYDRYRKM